MSSALEELIGICKSKNFNVSITYQKMNDCSVEIYSGYIKKYNLIYYRDGHSSPKKAIKKALKHLRKL